MTNVVIASAQSIFSIEGVSELEYIAAEKKCSRFNVYPADSIIDNEIVNLILKEAQNKFERLDSITKQEIYACMDANTFGFDKRQLIYLSELKLYGFCIPDTPFDDSVWWFDAESGRYLCSAACPTAMNANGMYVSQTGHDCDWPLELKFFCRDGDCYYEFQSYKSTQYNGETVSYQAENDEHLSIFWLDNNLLFLKTYNRKERSDVYLKIKAQPSIKDMIDNMMPNKAIKPAPKKKKGKKRN